MLGGIMKPSVPAPASDPMERLWSYLRRSSSGTVIFPTVAVVAAEEPLTAAKKVQARMLTWTSRPGMESIQGASPRKRSDEMRLRKRISPIQMKNGNAIMAEPLVLFQATFAMIEPKATSL